MSDLQGRQQCAVCGSNIIIKAETARDLPPGTMLSGRYLIGCALARGGFSIVYIVWDNEANVRRAVKEFFPTDLASRDWGRNTVSAVSEDLAENWRQSLALFLREARTLSTLEQRNHVATGFVRVFDSFEENNTAYLVMEYLEGCTLSQYLEKQPGKRIDWNLALALIQSVLAGAKVAHLHGIIHRDIAPDNIFLTHDGLVKLIHFGQAKEFVAGVTRSVAISLRAGYSPSEQYQTRGNVGPWTDVYAAGATLYKMVTGILPPETPMRFEGAKLIPPNKLSSGIPVRAQKAMLKALALRAEDRYQGRRKGIRSEQLLAAEAGARATQVINPGIRVITIWIFEGVKQ